MEDGTALWSHAVDRVRNHLPRPSWHIPRQLRHGKYLLGPRLDASLVTTAEPSFIPTVAASVSAAVVATASVTAATAVQCPHHRQ